ncbi:MAG: hypothetical protein JO043_10675 [Candidatus Eremiobacteraeota bacterium]|nr:hypothetical protein [Candidatus Eremiobacteraeota bacterium]
MRSRGPFLLVFVVLTLGSMSAAGGAVRVHGMPLPEFHATARSAQFSLLYSFKGPAAGMFPGSPLLQDKAGNLYGTTSYGGHINPQGCSVNGCGVVYMVDPRGTETLVHEFSGYPVDGALPGGGLVADAAGNLYGTAEAGGGSNSGVVYKIDAKGNETVLYSFCPNSPHCDDGRMPVSNLTIDAAGDLFGVTAYGGLTTGTCGGANFGCGVLFKIASSGKESVLYAFRGSPSDGQNPFANLILDDGKLVGTTLYGGTASNPCAGSVPGCGTLFSVTLKGKERVLHFFSGGNQDGDFPMGGVIKDNAGNVYGTTQSGGPANSGVVYEIDAASGSERLLYAFKGDSMGDGSLPTGWLVRDNEGKLYGTTLQGGAVKRGGYGTVYEVTPSGTEIVLHTFSAGRRDGAQPLAGLLRSGRTLYGTTNLGGAQSWGTVFAVRF